MSSTDMRCECVVAHPYALALTPPRTPARPRVHNPLPPPRAGARCARGARRSGACLRAGARPARGARGGGDGPLSLGPLRGRALVSGPRPCGVAECGVRREALAASHAPSRF